jgi:two-component system, sporulation sensor kinase C
MEDYPLPMVAAQDRDRIAAVLALAMRRTSAENVEFRSLHRRGEPRWMSLSLQPMYGEDGQYLGFRSSVRDVTDRRNLREQLRLHAEHLEQLVQERTSRLQQLELRQRQMEKLAALGQLAAGVAHEINNPLAGMRNAFELIKAGLSPEHEHFELLELIDREIERISGITHQMHQLYRRTPQLPTEFQMEGVVAEVASLLEHVASKRQVLLKVRPSRVPIRVLLPEGEVKQILYNLVRNAIQASPPQQEVLLRTTRSADEVAVEVKDSGPGIPADVLPRIFDPFFSTKQGESESGMGLGLSVSRSLIEAIGGRIEVVSHLKRGSVFTAVFADRPAMRREHSDG